MTNRTRTLRRLRRRRLTLPATFVALLALASGGVAMAASGYVQLRKSTGSTTPPPQATITVAPGCWQPPGCVFPAASAFAGR